MTQHTLTLCMCYIWILSFSSVSFVKILFGTYKSSFTNAKLYLFSSELYDLSYCVIFFVVKKKQYILCMKCQIWHQTPSHYYSYKDILRFLEFTTKIL